MKDLVTTIVNHLHNGACPEGLYSKVRTLIFGGEGAVVSVDSRQDLGGYMARLRRTFSLEELGEMYQELPAGAPEVVTSAIILKMGALIRLQQNAD